MRAKAKEPTLRPAVSAAPALPAWQRRAVLLVVLATAVLAGAVVWAMPRPIGDLYIALAGGRDVLEGQLGRPDTWSFATTDRVWINQNWGTHLVHYLAYRAAGQTGLLATKAVTIALLALGMTVAARQRGASWPVGLLTAAGVVLGAKAYVDLRPNLTTLTLAPWMLFLLLLARRRRRWVWAAVALVAVWANSHGGFTLGIAMLGLWAACHGLTSWGAVGFRPAFRRHWPLVAATLAAITLAGLANPFGLENLTHGMVVGNNKSVWRQVNEWRSIWQGDWGGFGSLWEFLTLAGLMLALSLGHVLSWRARRQRGAAGPLRPGSDDVAGAVFELVLLLAAVYMACSARRFIPLAMVLLAPLLARQLEWALAPARRARPLVAACLLLAVPAAAASVGLARHYRGDNPLFEPETTFERMVYCKSGFPTRLAEFINANPIQGRVFQDWHWEGYLHWRCPQLKLWIGGRAQQVYQEQAYRQRLVILERPAEAAAMLASLDVHLVIVPWNDATGLLVHHLTRAPQATWAVVYFDGLNVVLADCRDPASRALVDAAVEDRLAWGDTQSALLSRLACLTSRPLSSQTQVQTVRLLARQAVQQCLNPLGPHVLAVSWEQGLLDEQDVQLLERRYEELAALPQPHAHGIAALATCQRIAAALAGHHQAAGRPAAGQSWADRAEEMTRRIRDARRHWMMD